MITLFAIIMLLMFAYIVVFLFSIDILMLKIIFESGLWIFIILIIMLFILLKWGNSYGRNINGVIMDF